MFNIRINVTVPKELLNTREVYDAIAAKLRTKTAYDITRLFKQTVDGWHNKPNFARKFEFTRSKLAVQIYPNGSNAEQYALVNAGSPPHPIEPVNGRFLIFRSGYRASTRPRVLSSRAYVRYGSTLWKTHVNHPGFEAREFDAQIAEEYEETFQDDVQAAIASVVPRH